MPDVNALSTRDGVGARGHPSVVVGARAIGSALVTGVAAETAAHENRREQTGAVSCLDHLGVNPTLFVGDGALPRQIIPEQIAGLAFGSQGSVRTCSARSDARLLLRPSP